ncbi:polyprotein [Rhizoctonia solani flexivirus 1]|uniref:polyprotein n=1 Tax=Rhizoctonia solani flexivirus 1 TaxID=1871631 RepID=UPI0008091947|nr:polyprotein [Rhizoctonia solani flexivirus 1]ANR02706.1 polyprotein [Rhizoctonia solani flexivirus 1]
MESALDSPDNPFCLDHPDSTFCPHRVCLATYEEKPCHTCPLCYFSTATQPQEFALYLADLDAHYMRREGIPMVPYFQPPGTAGPNSNDISFHLSYRSQGQLSSNIAARYVPITDLPGATRTPLLQLPHCTSWPEAKGGPAVYVFASPRKFRTWITAFIDPADWGVSADTTRDDPFLLTLPNSALSHAHAMAMRAVLESIPADADTAAAEVAAEVALPEKPATLLGPLGHPLGACASRCAITNTPYSTKICRACTQPSVNREHREHANGCLNQPGGPVPNLLKQPRKRPLSDQSPIIPDTPGTVTEATPVHTPALVEPPVKQVASAVKCSCWRGRGHCAKHDHVPTLVNKVCIKCTPVSTPETPSSVHTVGFSTSDTTPNWFHKMRAAHGWVRNDYQVVQFANPREAALQFGCFNRDMEEILVDVLNLIKDHPDGIPCSGNCGKLSIATHMLHLGALRKNAGDTESDGLCLYACAMCERDANFTGRRILCRTPLAPLATRVGPGATPDFIHVPSDDGCLRFEFAGWRIIKDNGLNFWPLILLSAGSGLQINFREAAFQMSVVDLATFLRRAAPRTRPPPVPYSILNQIPGGFSEIVRVRTWLKLPPVNQAVAAAKLVHVNILDPRRAAQETSSGRRVTYTAKPTPTVAEANASWAETAASTPAVANNVARRDAWVGRHTHTHGVAAPVPVQPGAPRLFAPARSPSPAASEATVVPWGNDPLAGSTWHAPATPTDSAPSSGEARCCRLHAKPGDKHERQCPSKPCAGCVNPHDPRVSHRKLCPKSVATPQSPVTRSPSLSNPAPVAPPTSDTRAKRGPRKTTAAARSPLPEHLGSHECNCSHCPIKKKTRNRRRSRKPNFHGYEPGFCGLAAFPAADRDDVKAKLGAWPKNREYVDALARYPAHVPCAKVVRRKSWLHVVPTSKPNPHFKQQMAMLPPAKRVGGWKAPPLMPTTLAADDRSARNAKLNVAIACLSAWSIITSGCLGIALLERDFNATRVNAWPRRNPGSRTIKHYSVAQRLGLRPINPGRPARPCPRPFTVGGDSDCWKKLHPAPPDWDLGKPRTFDETVRMYYRETAAVMSTYRQMGLKTLAATDEDSDAYEFRLFDLDNMALARMQAREQYVRIKWTGPNQLHIEEAWCSTQRVIIKRNEMTQMLDDMLSGPCPKHKRGWITVYDFLKGKFPKRPGFGGYVHSSLLGDISPPRNPVVGANWGVRDDSVEFFSSSPHRNSALAVHVRDYIASHRNAHYASPHPHKPINEALMNEYGFPPAPPFSPTVAHPSHVALERASLSYLRPILSSCEWFGLFLRQEKIDLVGFRPPAGQYNPNCMAKDYRRYFGAEQAPPTPRSTAPVWFIHDAIMYLEPRIIGGWFDENPELNHCFATAVAPVEALQRDVSHWPTLYQLAYRGNDLIYTPENDGSGYYSQPISASRWPVTNEIVTPGGLRLSVAICQSRFAHHVLLITRATLVPDTNRAFDTPGFVHIPFAAHPFALSAGRRTRARLLNAVTEYAFRVSTTSLRDLYNKIAQAAITEPGTYSMSERRAAALGAYYTRLRDWHAPPGSLAGWWVDLQSYLGWPFISVSWLLQSWSSSHITPEFGVGEIALYPCSRWSSSPHQAASIPGLQEDDPTELLATPTFLEMCASLNYALTSWMIVKWLFTLPALAVYYYPYQTVGRVKHVALLFDLNFGQSLLALTANYIAWKMGAYSHPVTARARSAAGRIWYHLFGPRRSPRWLSYTLYQLRGHAILDAGFSFPYQALLAVQAVALGFPALVPRWAKIWRYPETVATLTGEMMAGCDSDKEPEFRVNPLPGAPEEIPPPSYSVPTPEPTYHFPDMPIPSFTVPPALSSSITVSPVPPGTRSAPEPVLGQPGPITGPIPERTLTWIPPVPSHTTSLWHGLPPVIQPPQYTDVPRYTSVPPTESHNPVFTDLPSQSVPRSDLYSVDPITHTTHDGLPGPGWFPTRVSVSHIPAPVTSSVQPSQFPAPITLPDPPAHDLPRQQHPILGPPIISVPDESATANTFDIRPVPHTTTSAPTSSQAPTSSYLSGGSFVPVPTHRAHLSPGGGLNSSDLDFSKGSPLYRAGCTYPLVYSLDGDEHGLVAGPYTTSLLLFTVVALLKYYDWLTRDYAPAEGPVLPIHNLLPPNTGRIEPIPPVNADPEVPLFVPADRPPSPAPTDATHSSVDEELAALAEAVIREQPAIPADQVSLPPSEATESSVDSNSDASSVRSEPPEEPPLRRFDPIGPAPRGDVAVVRFDPADVDPAVNAIREVADEPPDGAPIHVPDPAVEVVGGRRLMAPQVRRPRDNVYNAWFVPIWPELWPDKMRLLNNLPLLPVDLAPEPATACFWIALGMNLRVDYYRLFASYVASFPHGIQPGTNLARGATTLQDMENICTYFGVGMRLHAPSEDEYPRIVELAENFSRHFGPVQFGVGPPLRRHRYVQLNRDPAPGHPTVHALAINGNRLGALYHHVIPLAVLPPLAEGQQHDEFINGGQEVQPGDLDEFAEVDPEFALDSQRLQLRGLLPILAVPHADHAGLYDALAGRGALNPDAVTTGAHLNAEGFQLAPPVRAAAPRLLPATRVAVEVMRYDVCGPNPRKRAMALSRDLKRHPGELKLAGEHDASNIAKSADSMAEHVQRDPIRLCLINGTAGSGKSHLVQEFMRPTYERPGFSPQDVSVICPNEQLRSELMESIPIPGGKSYNYPLPGDALATGRQGTVIIDDIGMFWPGYLELLALCNPGLDQIVVTLDAAQGSAPFPIPGTASRQFESPSRQFGMMCARYATLTYRLAEEVCLLFGLPHPVATQAHGHIVLVSRRPESVPYLVGSPRFAEVQSRAGVQCLPFTDVQGQTIHGDVAIDLGGHTPSQADAILWVALTRARGTIFLVYDAALRPPPGRSAFQSGILTAIFAVAARNRSAVVTAHSDPDGLIRKAVRRHLAMSLSPQARMQLDLAQPVTAFGAVVGSDPGTNSTRHSVIPITEAELSAIRALMPSHPRPIHYSAGHAFHWQKLDGIATHRHGFIRDNLRHNFPVTNDQILKPDPKFDAPAESGPVSELINTPVDPIAISEPQLPLPESRERVDRSGRATMQIDETRSQAPLRHSGKDAASYDISMAKRIHARRRFIPVSGHKAGEKLRRAFLRWHPLPKLQFNPELFEACVTRCLQSWASQRTKGDIQRAVASSEPDWNGDYTKLFLKAQTVKKIGKLYGPAAPGQIVTTFPLSRTLRDAAFATYVEHVLADHKPAHMYLHAKRTPADAAEWYEEHWTPGMGVTATDYTAWDTGCDEGFLSFDSWLMDRVGLPQWYIQEYQRGKVSTYCYAGQIPTMQFSGDRWTWLLNTYRNIAITAVRYRARPGTACAFSGDDMILCGQLSPDPNFDASEWKLTAKVTSGATDVFCGMRFGAPKLTMDPYTLYTRSLIGLQDGRTDESFWRSITDAAKMVQSDNTALRAHAALRLTLAPRVLQTHFVPHPGRRNSAPS